MSFAAARRPTQTGNMQKISSTSRSTQRSVLWASALAGSAALLSAAGCVSGDDPGASGATGAVSGAGAMAGLGAGGLSGGSSGATGIGGSAAMSGAGGTTTGSGGLGTGGALAGAGGGGGSVVSGGTGGSVAGSGPSGGTTSSGGTGGTAEPCVDVEPPPSAEWPDATCQNWATETEECSAAWFAEYCDASCGRCTPQGTGGAGGTGNAGTGGTGSEPCVDVEPPPTAEWPDATCQNWATETEECGAEWFAEYCDVSCGRCTPEGAGGTGSGGSSGTGGVGPVDCSGEGLPNVTGGDGFATRYWDCCQPHCAQFNGHRCGQDGVSQSGSNQSACSGGQAYACYDEAPRAVSDCLSYGHIAKANPNCGGCYRIQFTGQGEHNANDPGSQAIRGKQMIVKVTNTGSDVGGNQFDLMIPGGGVGMFNACSQQWGTSDLGAQYGGFLTECTGTHQQKKDCVRQECMKIPSGRAREGCLWFVDWLQVADNPKFTSQQTDCPF
jgi:hypothetical protein